MEYVMGELETRKFAGIDLGKYAVQLSVYDEAGRKPPRKVSLCRKRSRRITLPADFFISGVIWRLIT